MPADGDQIVCICQFLVVYNINAYNVTEMLMLVIKESGYTFVTRHSKCQSDAVWGWPRLKLSFDTHYP